MCKMRPFLCLAGLALLAMFAAKPMAGQTVTDTVMVTVEGDLAGVGITTFEQTFRIGDTVQFVAEAYDSEGDPVSAVFTWASADTTAVRIDAATGLAVGVGKGSNVAIWVRAEAVQEMRLASFRPPDSLNWTGQDTIPIGANLQYCAYLVDAVGFLVSDSPGPPICPIVFLPRPEPFPSMFAGISRSRPEGFFSKRGLRPS
jgi:hypothetical protein